MAWRRSIQISRCSRWRSVCFQRRLICEGDNGLASPLPFKLVMADKRTNSEGLQIADMVARPVAISVLRPGQPNRAMTILQSKLWRGPDGQVSGSGLKCFPEKNERPPGSPIPKLLKL